MSTQEQREIEEIRQIVDQLNDAYSRLPSEKKLKRLLSITFAVLTIAMVLIALMFFLLLEI